MTEPSTEPAVDFLKNGEVRFPSGNREVRLRRATMAEWRTLREAQWEANDEITTMLREIQDAALLAQVAQEAVNEAETVEAQLPLLPALRDAQDAHRILDRKYAGPIEALRVGWVRAVVEALNETPLTDDEIAPWMAGGSFMQALANHLQTVPLALGDS